MKFPNMPDGGKLKPGNSSKHAVPGNPVPQQGGKSEPCTNFSYQKDKDSYAHSGDSYKNKVD